MGVFQKGSPAIYNWLGWLDDYKPVITHRVVYLKKEKKTYALPKSSGGFINDIDDGLPFWPDGQTDDCVYMIRTVTEMRETVKRTGSSRQKDLIKFLDDPKVFERDFVMIVARPLLDIQSINILKIADLENIIIPILFHYMFNLFTKFHYRESYK